MLGRLTIAGCLALLVILVSACGGGEPEESPFKPRPVPSEYQGLSMEELQAKSKTPSYKELRDNIDSHQGKLVWFEGKVYQNFEGTEPNTYQVFVYVTPIEGTDEWKWEEQVLLLHSLDRGPELLVDGRVVIAGLVIGAHDQVVERNWRRFAPIISVVKAELVKESD